MSVCMYVELRELRADVQCRASRVRRQLLVVSYSGISKLHPHSSIFLLLPFGAGSSGVRE
jgi:hypothetical protein